MIGNITASLTFKIQSIVLTFLKDVPSGLNSKQTVQVLGTGATGEKRDVRWPMELLSCLGTNCIKNPNIFPRGRWTWCLLIQMDLVDRPVSRTSSSGVPRDRSTPGIYRKVCIVCQVPSNEGTATGNKQIMLPRRMNTTSRFQCRIRLLPIYVQNRESTSYADWINIKLPKYCDISLLTNERATLREDFGLWKKNI